MKIWEKIFLVVIALFLLVLNLCNVLVFRSSYQKNVDSVEQTAISYWKHIAFSLGEDIEEQGKEETTEWQLFQTYVSNFSNQRTAFELWKGKELRVKSEVGTQMTYSASEGTLHSAFLEKKEKRDEILMTKEQDGHVTILEQEGEKYTCTSGLLTENGYCLVIYENVTELLTVWERQVYAFVLMEIAASFVMAGLLYLVMRKFLQPISQLSAATAKIAAGDYFYQLEVKGKDELSELAKDINRMAEQVRENMQNKEAEAERKQEFIDALSHELRTPLTSVRGYAQLVQNTVISIEKQREYMDYIVRESGRMIDITESLRQVILIRQEEMDREEISLKHLCEQLQEMVQWQLTEKHIHWHFQADYGTVTASRVLTELFFLNLIRNSFHACEEEGNISVSLTKDKAVIADDGAGMTEECQAHIFEPFYREDKSRSRKLGGTGLGMYLCRHIADWHQWRIQIESEKGRGTRISVFFTL